MARPTNVKVIALILVAAILSLAGCGGGGSDPISRATLEQRLRREYAHDGNPKAKVECTERSGKYRCTATLNGVDGGDGTVYTTYSLSGHEIGDTEEAIP